MVAPGDPEALAATVLALLGDPERRRRAGEAGRRWAADRTWPRVARPLLEFAAAPRRDPHRDRFGTLAPGALVAPESLALRVVRRLGRVLGVR